jgi:maltooligosyltrehalose trehalohydrolase
MQHLTHLRPPLGATYLGEDRYDLNLWAPKASAVTLRLLDPQERLVPMQPTGGGFYQVHVEGVAPGTRYFFRLTDQESGESKDRPDPTARALPEGVHGPSQLIDPHFDWGDASWAGIPLQHFMIYELHVGTFTPEGTFDAVIPHLAQLKELGITAIELMPVAQFAGDRNWGYDGVAPFAVQDSYGGPVALKRLVNACHQAGLAVVLDVVYNHFGAEGNYLWDYGPYFTDRYHTPWGDAVNFDGPGSDQVRRYFIENAVYFLRDFHIDALRLDAVHAMLDFSATPFLEELAAVVDREAVHLNRRVYLIAESDLNDARLVRSRENHGDGLDAQWSDDFHHALHVLLTGDSQGYYRDFVDESGAQPLQFLVKALREGFVYSGQYSVVRGRRHGNSSREIPAYRFVVCIQNHDQVGNRMNGERLTALTSWARAKLGAALLLLAPYVPLLFMGEEYGETAPFLFFTSNNDETLVELVREGRKREFSDFMAQGEPADPYAEETFQRSKLNHALAQEGQHRELRDFYRTLIQLRKTLPALELLSKDHTAVHTFGAGSEGDSPEERVLLLHRWYGEDQVIALFNFANVECQLQLPFPAGTWQKLTDSSLGQAPFPAEVISPGQVEITLPAESFALYELQ